MMIVNQRQMDLVLSSSSSSATITDQILAAADCLGQGSVGLNEKLDMIDQHLEQLVRIKPQLRMLLSHDETTTHFWY
jgi:hypothetical protein